MLISGKQIKSIPATKVVTSTEKQFTSASEKSLWNGKTSVNDSNTSSSTTWSSQKIQSSLDTKLEKSSNFSLEYDELEEAITIVFK